MVTTLVVKVAFLLLQPADSFANYVLHRGKISLQASVARAQENGFEVEGLHVWHEADEGVSVMPDKELLKVPADVRGLDGIPKRLHLGEAGVGRGWALGLCV